MLMLIIKVNYCQRGFKAHHHSMTHVLHADLTLLSEKEHLHEVSVYQIEPETSLCRLLTYRCTSESLFK